MLGIAHQTKTRYINQIVDLDIQENEIFTVSRVMLKNQEKIRILREYLKNTNATIKNKLNPKYTKILDK